jgi:hypothetical protein
MNETEFAYRIRQGLDEGAERLDYRITYRLEQARSRALARHRAAGASEASVRVPTLQLATAARAVRPAPRGFWAWMYRAALVLPILALVIGYIGIYDWQRAQTIEQIANLDFAVLVDQTPIDTFADSGFGVMLKNQDRTN